MMLTYFAFYKCFFFLLNNVSCPIYLQVDPYHAIGSETAAYHRRFIYDINYLRGIVDDFPDGSECPVCAEVSYGVESTVISDNTLVSSLACPVFL